MTERLKIIFDHIPNCEIFADIGKAITFFDEIVDNLVTPIDLPYILEDRILT